MPETITQFCVCDEDWCFCDHSTQMKLEDAARGLEWTCPDCAAGHHQLSPTSTARS